VAWPSGGSKRCTVAYTITNLFLSKYFERNNIGQMSATSDKRLFAEQPPHHFPLRLTLSLAPSRGGQLKLSFVSVPHRLFPLKYLKSFPFQFHIFRPCIRKRRGQDIFFYHRNFDFLPLSYHTQHNFGILRESAELASTRFYEVTESCR